MRAMHNAQRDATQAVEASAAAGVHLPPPASEFRLRDINLHAALTQTLSAGSAFTTSVQPSAVLFLRLAPVALHGSLAHSHHGNTLNSSI